jgi:SAM-dependent methyltransferase
LAALPSTTYTLEDQQHMARAKNYFAWQGRLVTRELGRRVVEVGCGLGNFTGLLLDRDVIVAVDVEPDCVARLQARYPNQGNLHAFACDAGNAAFAQVARFQPDSCVCLNVLEHIENDREALSRMASVLGPEGVIVLIVPAFQSLYGPIDRNLGHYRRYSRASVRKLAAELGLRVNKLRFMNTVGFFGWWANSHIFRREKQSPGQIEFFDRYIVPVMSRVEGWVPPPYGQSLLVVLRKQAGNG